jgi:hypothetical protein
MSENCCTDGTSLDANISIPTLAPTGDPVERHSHQGFHQYGFFSREVDEYIQLERGGSNALSAWHSAASQLKTQSQGLGSTHTEHTDSRSVISQEDPRDRLVLGVQENSLGHREVSQDGIGRNLRHDPTFSSRHEASNGSICREADFFANLPEIPRQLGPGSHPMSTRTVPNLTANVMLPPCQVSPSRAGMDVPVAPLHLGGHGRELAIRDVYSGEYRHHNAYIP